MITAILTIGASLWLGLLSFSGMFVLIPSVGLALSAFVLSVLYDGEIYQKNINNALNKLFNNDLIAEKIGEEAVRELQACEFLEEYRTATDPERLKKMHIWLGRLLLAKKSSTLVKIEANHNWEQRALELSSRNRALIGFSALAAVLMIFGTTYLLLEAISVVTFITIAPAILPYIVLPIAVISGIAYGFLTYNSSSDFLLDTSLSDWWGKFKTQLSSNPFYVIGASLILLLNLALTLCTAGTWWTVINQQRSVWPWLQNISTRAMQWLTTAVIGVSTLGFNLRNTIETIKEMSPHEHSDTTCSSAHDEHPVEAVSIDPAPVFNPILLLLKITYTPVRVLMFLGHLISIGVTGDRMPGMSAIFSALLGIISEAFEDAHYFFDIRHFFKNLRHTFGLNNDDHHEHTHEHHHGHEHSDLPNQILQMILSPVVALAALWNWGFDRSPETSWARSWNAVNQDLYGIKPNTPEHDKTEKLNRFKAIRSDEWAKQETHMILEEALEQCTDTAKYHDLEQIQSELTINAMREMREETRNEIYTALGEQFDNCSEPDNYFHLMKIQEDLNASKLSARKDINAMYERIMFWQPQPQQASGTPAAALSLR